MKMLHGIFSFFLDEDMFGDINGCASPSNKELVDSLLQDWDESIEDGEGGMGEGGDEGGNEEEEEEGESNNSNIRKTNVLDGSQEHEDEQLSSDDVNDGKQGTHYMSTSAAESSDSDSSQSIIVKDKVPHSKTDRHKPRECYFCHKVVPRVGEHYKSKHKDEPKVQEILKEAETKKKHIWKFQSINNQVDYAKNNDILTQQGMVGPLKEARSKSNSTQKVNCGLCFARVSKNYYKSHHIKICPGNKTEPVVEKVIDFDDHDFFKSVIQPITKRKKSGILENELLLSYGKDVWEDVAYEKPEVVKKKLKDARLLEETLKEKLGDDFNLNKVMDREYINQLISIIKDLGGFGKEGKFSIFKNPSLALRACDLLLEIAEFERKRYDLKDDAANETRVKKFIATFGDESKKKIKKFASLTMQRRKFNKPVEIPLTSDIKKIDETIDKNIIDLMNKIKDENLSCEEKFIIWKDLRDNLMTSILIFTRQRGGAVEKLTIEEYYKAKENPVCISDEIRDSLDESDKFLLNNLLVIDLEHKHCLEGQLLLTKIHVQGVDLLIFYRKCFPEDIYSDNPFVFPAEKSMNPVRGGDKLRNLRDGTKITSTLLRKHYNTAMQVVNETQGDQRTRAKVMGHSWLTQQRRYTITDKVRSMVVGGRQAALAKSGNFSGNAGKTIREIDITSTSTYHKTISLSLSSMKISNFILFYFIF